MRRDIHPFAVAKKIKQRTGLMTKQGAFLVNWYKRNDKLNYKINKMYVVKYNTGVYKRGQKLFTKPAGVECRNIFYYCKETRERLRDLINIFDKPLYNQIGFCNNRGIYNAIEILELGNTYYTMDLSNAFDSITREMIYYLLHYVYDVNKKLATKISYDWTYEGHMMQGHPLAPLFFNLWTSQAVDFLNMQGVKLIQYADDLIVASDYEYISFNRMKFIKSAFKRIGFDINLNKTNIIHSHRELIFLGQNITRNTCKHRYKRKRIWKHLKYLADKFGPNCLIPKNNPENVSKSSNDKNIDILKGHLNWIYYNPRECLENYYNRKEKTTKPNPTIPKKDLWKLWTNPVAIH